MFMISVLYIDDNLTLLRITSKILINTGEFLVDTSYTLWDARTKLSDGTYDAMVTDYGMNGTDNFDILRHLRLNDCRIPMIYFVASRNFQFESEAQKFGSVDFVPKISGIDANFSGLGEAIRNQVQQKRTAMHISSHSDCVIPDS